MFLQLFSFFHFYFYLLAFCWKASVVSIVFFCLDPGLSEWMTRAGFKNTPTNIISNTNYLSLWPLRLVWRNTKKDNLQEFFKNTFMKYWVDTK